MTAVDTNVLVRLLTADDPAEETAARTVFESEPIWIAKTVLLETNWDLRSIYGLDDASVRMALGKLLGLKNVHAEDRSSIVIALDLTERGIEFADALHLLSRPAGAAFVSFDRSFVKRAEQAGIAGVRLLSGRRSVRRER